MNMRRTETKKEDGELMLEAVQLEMETYNDEKVSMSKGGGEVTVGKGYGV